MSEEPTARDALSVDAWRIIRRALAGGRIEPAEYDLAMTEVMGTSDRGRW